MRDNTLFHRILGYLVFDIPHIDSEIIKIYATYAKNKVNSFISSEPDLPVGCRELEYNSEKRGILLRHQ